MRVAPPISVLMVRAAGLQTTVMNREFHNLLFSHKILNDCVRACVIGCGKIVKAIEGKLHEVWHDNFLNRGGLNRSMGNIVYWDDLEVATYSQWLIAMLYVQ